MQYPTIHLRRTFVAGFLSICMVVMLGIGHPGTTLSRVYAQSPDTNSEPAAATISFANPSALTATVEAGDDFATTVLGNPWDMDVARDLGYEIGFSNISATDGIWSGTFSGIDKSSGAASTGYLFPLFQGFSTPIANQLSQELAFNQIGARDEYAINAAKYTRLSYRMSVSPRTTSSPLAVMWTTASPVTWPTGENRFARLDACQGTTQFFPWKGWQVYNFDLTQQNGDPAARNGTWQGLVRGLRIDPSASGAPGTQIKLDWIRLSDPRSAPTIAIPWSLSEAGTRDRVDLYVADNPAGTDAAPIAFGIAASAGTYNLPTSILPPGQHYFQLRLQDGSVQNGCTITKNTSTWVGPLTITTKPVVRFVKPSMTSGPDYATVELGQPWDMESSDDIVTPPPPYPQTLTQASFSNGIFSARTIINPPQTESDSQLWLHVDPSRPINSNRYRYFTVRLKVDLPPDKDINWAISNGWGGRIIWWNTGIQADGSETKYGTYYEGWRNYSVDLTKAVPPLPLSDPAQARNILTPREQNTFPAQLGWKQLGSVGHLRFDPLETMQAAVGTGADVFSIDWVKLTANDEVQRGKSFTIKVGLNLTPQSLKALKFYYTTDRTQPTQNEALRIGQTTAVPQQTGLQKVYLPLVTLMDTTDEVTSVETVANPMSFAWDTTSVAPGTYYICSTAETEASTSTYCSETPVVVLP